MEKRHLLSPKPTHSPSSPHPLCILPPPLSLSLCITAKLTPPGFTDLDLESSPSTSSHRRASPTSASSRCRRSSRLRAALTELALAFSLVSRGGSPCDTGSGDRGAEPPAPTSAPRATHRFPSRRPPLERPTTLGSRAEPAALFATVGAAVLVAHRLVGAYGECFTRPHRTSTRN
jgi:hypothetical protein